MSHTLVNEAVGAVDRRPLLPGLRDVPRAGLGLLAALLLLRTALLLAGDALLDLVTPGPLTASDLLWANVSVVAVDVITMAVLWRLLRRSGRGWRDLLGPVGVRDLGWGLLAFVLLYPAFLVGSFVGNLLAYQGPPPAGEVPDVPLWLGLWSLTVMPVTVAVAEECLYRGWLQHQLHARLGAVPAVLVVALAFGLQHVAFTVTSAEAALARVVATTVAGLVLGLLVLRFRRLAPLVLAHWLLDVVGLGLPVLAAALA